MRIAVALSSLIPFIALVSGAAVPSAVLDEAFPFPAGQASALLALPDTENGLAEGCKAVTFLFARGTNEDGNVGARIGPQVIDLLRTALGVPKLTAQGLDYAANVAGYLVGGDPAGTTTLVGQINTLVTACPSTKIVLSGYSQGAQVVHKAADKLTAAVSARINAVVVFGDPYRSGKTTVPGFNLIPTSKVLNICHTGDIICTGLGGSAQHLNYDADAPQASTFILNAVGTV